MKFTICAAVFLETIRFYVIWLYTNPASNYENSEISIPSAFKILIKDWMCYVFSEIHLSSSPTVCLKRQRLGKVKEFSSLDGKFQNFSAAHATREQFSCSLLFLFCLEFTVLLFSVLWLGLNINLLASSFIASAGRHN